MTLQIFFDTLRFLMIILASIGAIWEAIDHLKYGTKIEKGIILFYFLILFIGLTTRIIVK